MMDEKVHLETGKIVRIAGPVISASGLEKIRLLDVVRVGDMGLVGEVIRLSGDLTTIQVYEDTSGIRIGEPVYNTAQPLVAHLGPGLLGMVYDGLQRPLKKIAEMTDVYIQRGISASALPEDKGWYFTPSIQPGTLVNPGDVLGEVSETQMINHLIMVPPDISGQVIEIKEGEFRIDESIGAIELTGDNNTAPFEISLVQTWPVRKPRPFETQLVPREPLITGTRIIDVFFPLAKGGTAIIPGGFGTGKTVIEHSLASWADIDIVVYVGCGERGNEMTEVLEEFPKLEDPRTGSPLMERTVLIANTSNMPVAAREASIYTGITIAEYYRDMGYDVLLLADSTSRWGEALREISGRLEEMPGEEGYPAYLAARLAEYYERSGRVVCLGDEFKSQPERRSGSVSIVGAVSPPGGDFSEPITQNSMRVVGTFWALDYDLSRRRHFPAINWTRSYSLYDFSDWYSENICEGWVELIESAMALLQREVELIEIVQLVGPDALAETERAELAVARVLREDFLQQSAYHEVDSHCPVDKAYWMLKVIMLFYELTQIAIGLGIPVETVMALEIIGEIARMKNLEARVAQESIEDLIQRIRLNFEELGAK